MMIIYGFREDRFSRTGLTSFNGVRSFLGQNVCHKFVIVSRGPDS